MNQGFSSNNYNVPFWNFLPPLPFFRSGVPDHQYPLTPKFTLLENENKRLTRNLAYYEKALARARGLSRCRKFESIKDGTVDRCDFSDDTDSGESDGYDDSDENEENDEDENTDGTEEDEYDDDEEDENTDEDDDEYEEDDESSKKKKKSRKWNWNFNVNNMNGNVLVLLESWNSLNCVE